VKGIDVGLSAPTYWVWKRVIHGLGLEWDRLSTSVSDPRSIWAWRSEVVVERFHASILRRLAERALEAGEPRGEGEVWRIAGGTTGHWLELDDLLRTLRAHREVEECQLLARPEEEWALADPAAAAEAGRDPDGDGADGGDHGGEQGG
jgi:hypothetical protein